MHGLPPEFPSPVALSRLSSQQCWRPLRLSSTGQRFLPQKRRVDFYGMAQSALPATVGQQPVRVISRADVIKMKDDVVAELREDLSKPDRDLECIKDANSRWCGRARSIEPRTKSIVTRRTPRR